jgi:hypothetical protein
MDGYELGAQANQLKDFSVTIDGVKLTSAQVTSIKMRWEISSFNVVGSIVFRDLSNLLEGLPIRGDNTIVMAMTDFDDVVSKQSFTVVDVGQIRTKSGDPAVILKFIDPISLTAIRMFNPMSWKSENIQGIIDHPETLKPSLTGKKKDFCPPPPNYENFVMHLGVSFNVTMHWLAKKDNVLWFQSREAFIMQPFKELYGRSKKGDKFRYKTPNNAYRRRIYSYDVIFGKVLDVNRTQPTGKVTSFDSYSKAPVIASESNSGSQSKLSSTGNTPQSVTPTGERHYYKSITHVSSYTEHMWSKNSHKDVELVILVPGQFATNIGDIVELDVVNYNRTEEPEYNINGEWLVTRIVDNITPPDFFQRITLSRAKFSK